MRPRGGGELVGFCAAAASGEQVVGGFTQDGKVKAIGADVGAYFAARGSSLGHAQSAMLGYMMNTRGLMELIVINVGLDLGVISPKVFTMLVIMAIVSTVITTPALRYYLPRAGLGEALP